MKTDQRRMLQRLRELEASKDWRGVVALEHEARAVAITVRAASPQDAVCVYNFLGIANQSLVDFGKAIDYHMQCLDEWL